MGDREMSVALKECKFVDDRDTMQDWAWRNDLPWRRKKEAQIYHSMSRGIFGVFGPPGSGKDLFGVSTAWLQKYYFGRRILLDFLPKKAFGQYTLFDGRVMMDEINKMARASGVEGIENSADQKEYDEFIGNETERWALEGEGYVMLQGAVLYLSELKRYCYKRQPHNKFNKFIGSINSIVRHLDLLVIGTHVFENEIDNFTFMQYVHTAGLKAKCEWMISREHTTKVIIERYGYMGADCAYGNISGKTMKIIVDGNTPRDYLGGKRFYDLWESKNFVNLKPVAAKEM